LTTSPIRDTLEYVDSDVELGATYFYSVMAINPYGMEGPRTDCEDVLVAVPPGDIFDLTASAGDGWVNLTWTAPATTWGLPITGYIVLKGTVPDGMLEVAFPRDPYFRDVFVDNGITYHYAVRAVTIAGAGDFGLIVNATPQGRPIAPGEFSAHYAGGKVVLRWEQPTGPCAPVTGYVLLKGTSDDKMVLLAELGLVTEYIDKDIEPGHSYYYSVRAASEIGEGSTTESVTVSVPRDLGLLKTTTIALVLLLVVLLIVLVGRWRRARAIDTRTGPEEEPEDGGTGAGEALPGGSSDEHPIGETPNDARGERAGPSGGDASRPGGIPGAGSESSTSKRPG
jgi:hypothetical protein